MVTKDQKKDMIRVQIIAASHHYRDHLAGRVFLYVIGDTYFEVVFKTDRFLHLTGVSSTLRAREFYNKAKSATLTTENIVFDQKHTYLGAKQKLPCLLMLRSLTDHLVCVVRDMKTLTLTYRIGVTNLNFTLGLTENVDSTGQLINSWFLPRTLRVKDHAVENSSSAEFVDFIFSKDASHAKYDTLCFADAEKTIPKHIRDMLVSELAAAL